MNISILIIIWLLNDLQNVYKPGLNVTYLKMILYTYQIN